MSQTKERAGPPLPYSNFYINLDEPYCKVRDLSVLGYAQGFTQYHYKSSTDTIATMTTGGYFNTARIILSPGDHILLTACDGGAARFVRYSDNMRGVILERLK